MSAIPQFPERWRAKEADRAIDPTRYQSLGEILGDALVQFKTNLALVETDRKRESASYSYLELKRASMAVARWLVASRLGPGDRVAILMSNQSRWLIGALGALHRGAVLVPIDYKLSPAEQRALLNHSKAKVLLVEYPLWKRLVDAGGDFLPRALVSEAPGVRAAVNAAAEAVSAELARCGAERWELLDEEGPEPAFVRRTRDDVASIVYSSGTGGRPKGCQLTHDAYLEQYRSLSAIYPLVEGDRYFSILPTNHAIDFMCGFVGPLCGGATVVHQRTLRPEFLLDTMKRYRVTHMALVPLVLTAFERALKEKLDALPPWKRTIVDTLANANESLTRRAPNRGLSRALLRPIHEAFGGELKYLFCGGAFVDRARAEFFYRLGIPVVIGYGLTEACTVVTLHDLRPFRADSVGRPLPGTEVKVVDPDANGIGEVLVRSRTLMKGYLDDDALTAETIVDGWLKTGDRGWLDASNHLHLVGRSRNMIVTEGGKNVYPEDVESAFEGLPCEELAVYAADYLWPRGKLVGEELVAVVRPRANGPDAVELLAQIRAKNRVLPEHKRLAGLIEWSDAFPRTASMKLKRDPLAESLREELTRDAIRPMETVVE